jgi:multiple sugar transport system substrate-binding protein
MSTWRLAKGRTEGVMTVSDDLRWQARLSRRHLLLGLAMSASAGVLAACGGGASGGGGAATTPAAGATVGSGATTAPAVQSTGTATTVVWFAARDTTGYTPKQVEAFNKANKNIQIDYQEQGATTQDLHDKFVTVAGAKDASVDIVSMDVPYVPEFAAAGWTIPVDEILPKDEQAKFFQGTLHGATYQASWVPYPGATTARVSTTARTSLAPRD